jgi:hypothetical protein
VIKMSSTTIHDDVDQDDVHDKLMAGIRDATREAAQ